MWLWKKTYKLSTHGGLFVINILINFQFRTLYTLYYIIWLSLIQVTDWLNTVTWFKHRFSMFPSPKLRIDRYHKMFSLGENFSRKQMAKWACDNIVSKCMLTALDCAQEPPHHHHWTVWITEFLQEFFCQQGNGEPYNITDGDFVVRNFTECS